MRKAAYFLVTLNFVGLFWYTEVDYSQREKPDEDLQISMKEFREMVADGNLIEAVHKRLIWCHPSKCIPTIAENWIIWPVATLYNKWEWTDTIRALRCGGGFCSQHAIVVANILNKAGVPCRVKTLGGHVINEAWLNDEWVNLDASLNKIGAEYQEYPKKETYWEAKDGIRYSPWKYLFEYFALYAVWIIPFLILIVSHPGRMKNGRTTETIRPRVDEVREGSGCVLRIAR